MSGPRRRFWGRYCVMDDFDDAMFSFALRETYPDVVFIRGGILFESPDYGAAETIPECSQSGVDIWFPRKGWEPIFFPHPEYPDRYEVINPPQLYLHYNRTHWFFESAVGERKWVFSLPMPEQGRISSGRWIWDDEKKEFRSAIIRIIGRLTTNRLKDWFERNQAVSVKNARRRNTWAGYHVLDWCRGGPRRMIDGRFRPCDDWQPKYSSWYRRIREKVVERFGDEYGGPRRFKPRPMTPFPVLRT